MTDRVLRRKCRELISFTYADETRCDLPRGHAGPHASSNSAADALQEQMPVGTPLLYYVICGAMTKHPGWEEDAKLIYEAVGEWFVAHAIPNREANWTDHRTVDENGEPIEAHATRNVVLPSADPEPGYERGWDDGYKRGWSDAMRQEHPPEGKA